MKFSTVFLCCVLCTGLLVLPMYGQQSLFLETTALENPDVNEERVFINHLNVLQNAKSSRNGETFLVALPLWGQEILFEASENNVVDDEFHKVSPDVLTYNISSRDIRQVSGTMTVTPYGLFALILQNGKMISIRPDQIKSVNEHIVEYGVKPDLSKYKLKCGHDHTLDAGQGKVLFRPLRNNFQNGEIRKTYNVAIITTGEYYQANGNSNALVRAKVIADVNSISAIFQNELAVTLAVGNRITMHSDPATDPFIPGDERTLQAANAVADAYPNQNTYHVGHVFHIHQDGDGWQNGGVALLNSVCRNTDYGSGFSKGGGWSGAFNNVDNGWIALAAHEFGHQFGAMHTFNGTGESCTDAIASANAYEIGSGSTIMSYQGVCQTDNNIPSSGSLDNYFHYASLLQMYTYITDGDGNTCGTEITSNNAIPILSANPCGAPQITIPRNTPFYVSAFAFDIDNDPITYCWEQFDEDGAGTSTQGFIGPMAGNSLTAPLFRSFPPTQNSFRYFPRMEVLRTVGGTNDFEVLSNRPRTLKFVVTARDNNSGGGAINTDEIDLTVSSSGPFVIDFPKGGEVVVGGSPVVIRWNTNNTNAFCQKVRIKLSFDDGLNYNYTIAENVDYAAGQLPYVFPATLPATTTARVLIECMDYDCIKFFNISRSVFFISTDCTSPETYICPTTSLTADAGSPELNLDMTAIKGKIVSSMQGNITNGSGSMRVAINNVNSTSCVAIPNVTINVDSKRFRVEKSGIYSFRRSTGGSGWISIFRASSFNMSNPCSGTSFVGSSATWQGPDVGNGTSVLPLSVWSVPLEECVEYIMVFYSYSALPATVLFQDISGPGSFYEINTNPTSNFSITHLAVEFFTGTVFAHSPTADFSSLPEGTYLIYTVSYKTSGATPPNNVNPDDWIGSDISFVQSDFCTRLSTNSRLLRVLSACSVQSIETGIQSPCEVATNSYTQELIITYDQAPNTGQLSVNGQLFDITGSPQTIVLNNLDSDGQAVDVVAFFTDLQTCRLEEPALFTAPVNCCPVTFDLGGSREVCTGIPLVLNAGQDGQTYVWTKDGIDFGHTQSTLNVTESGTYSVTVTHSSGCSKKQTVVLTFVDPPTVTLVNPLEICEGETFTLTPAIIGPYVSVEWFRNNTIIEGENGVTLDITTGGSYRVELTNNAGCKGSAVSVVTVLPNPSVDLGNNNINVCEGVPVVLNAGNPTLNHTWYFNGNIINGAVGSTYTVPDGQSGNYRAVVTNSAECEGFDEATVNFFQSPSVEIESEINVCEGDTAIIEVVAFGYETFVWKKDNIIITPTDGLIHKTTQEGLYTFEATNLGNCTTSKSVLVNVNAIPVVDLGEDIIACIGNTVNLNAGTSGNNYKWTRDGMTINENNPVISVTLAGVYVVTVTNQQNCSESDEIEVSFVPGPTVNAGNDITICDGDSEIITATTDATNIAWLLNGNPISNQTSKSITVTDPGTYTIVVIGGPSNCEARDEVVVVVNDKPLVNIGADQRICTGDTVVLNAGTGQDYSYTWTRDNNAAGSTQMISATMSGTFRVTVTTPEQCLATDEMILTVVPLPTLVLEDTFNICDNTPEVIMPVSNGSGFQWFKDGVVIPGQIQKDLSVNSAGLYLLVVTNADNCVTSDSVVVTSRPAPTVDLGLDKEACPGESFDFDAGLGSQLNYLWSTGAMTRQITVNAGMPMTQTTTNYSVTVTNQFDCSATDVVSITTKPVVNATIVSSAPGVCSGNPVTLTASGGDTYVWTDPDGSLSATNTNIVIASPEVSTTYMVEVIDDECPENTDIETIVVNVFQPVNVSAGKDTSVIIGRTIELDATGGVAYVWNNTSLIVGANTIRNPEVSITENTTFVVTITDINGCNYVDSVLVRLLEDPLSSFVPVSAITPNNDGDNDVLEFIGLEAFPENVLRIYSRWGNIVFEGFNYQSSGVLFDGTRNGERLPPDTYYYILTFEDNVYKSALTIIWD